MSKSKANDNIVWLPFPRTERAKPLNNPYCGLYSMFRFYVDDDSKLDKGISLDDIILDSNHQICLIEINLIKFNQKPLSVEALLNVNRIFRFFTLEDKQMIVRFLYDWEGKGILTEPKDIQVILDHMKQLSEILKEYEKSIYILQGLFIGSWGEMHNSRYLGERQMIRLANQLYQSSGKHTQIALRCPNYWRMIFKSNKPLNESMAYSELMKSRFSLFNDGMLASETDFGTYGDIYASDAKKYEEKWVRADELDFQEELCKYVSNGGEAINLSEYNDGKASIRDLRKMRVSYLHSQYDLQVLNKWKKTKSGLSDPLWKDKTSFEYIAAHLGYRLTIEDVKVTSYYSEKIKVNIKINNRGFAPSYHSFEVKVIVRDLSYEKSYEYKIDTDTRFWMPDETIDLHVDIPIGELSKDKYIISLGIYDPRSRQAIKIANTFSSIDYKGNYSLGNIQV